MQSIKRPKNKKPLVILLSIVALALIIAAAYFLVIRPLATGSNDGDLRPVNDVNYEPATEEEKKDSERAKEEIIKDEQAKQLPPQTQSPDGSIVITISRAGQVGSSVSVRTIIDGAKTGECVATFTRGSDTVTKSGTIIFEVNSYTCSLDIPASEFNASGTWSMSVVAKSGSATSQPATQSVTVAK